MCNSQLPKFRKCVFHFLPASGLKTSRSQSEIKITCRIGSIPTGFCFPHTSPKVWHPGREVLAWPALWRWGGDLASGSGQGLQTLCCVELVSIRRGEGTLGGSEVSLWMLLALRYLIGSRQHIFYKKETETPRKEVICSGCLKTGTLSQTAPSFDRLQYLNLGLPG